MYISLSLPLRIYEIIDAVEGVPFGIPKHLTVDGVSTDSRTIKPGCLFLALPGERYNGENFVSSVLLKGGIPITTKRLRGAITVDNTTDALLSLAELFASKLPGLTHIFGITGSVGKTTTKNAVSKVIGLYKSTHATPENNNNAIGVALTVLSAPADTEVLVLEMGMNHAGEIAQIVKYIAPDTAIITGIGTSHIGNLGSREAIAKAKWEIASNVKTKLTLCDSHAAEYAKKHRHAVVSVDSDGDFSLLIRRLGKGDADFDFLYRNCKHSFDNIPVLGRHNLKALAFALSATVVIGEDPNKAENGINKAENANTSGKFIKLSDYTLYDDAYNSSFESVIADIEMLLLLGNEISLILGDILELGDAAKEIHYKLGAAISKYKINNLYLFGKLSENIRRGALDGGMNNSRIFYNPDTDSPEITADCVMKNHIPGEVILLKASHKIDISRIGKIITEKENTP